MYTIPFHPNFIYASGSEPGPTAECAEGLCPSGWSPGGHTLHHHLKNGGLYQPQDLQASSRTYHHLPCQGCELGEGGREGERSGGEGGGRGEWEGERSGGEGEGGRGEGEGERSGGEGGQGRVGGRKEWGRGGGQGRVGGRKRGLTGMSLYGNGSTLLQVCRANQLLLEDIRVMECVLLSLHAVLSLSGGALQFEEAGADFGTVPHPGPGE